MGCFLWDRVHRAGGWKEQKEWAGGNSPRESTKATTRFMGFGFRGGGWNQGCPSAGKGVSVTNQFGVLRFGNCSWPLGHVFGRVLIDKGCATRVTLLLFYYRVEVAARGRGVLLTEKVMRWRFRLVASATLMNGNVLVCVCGL